MTITKTLALLLAALAAWAAWKFRAAEMLQPALQRIEGRADGAAPALRKCRQGATVSYTQAPCPPGHQEQVLSGGTVTVVEGSRPEPQLPALNLPDARALRGDPNEPTLAERHIERAAGR